MTECPNVSGLIACQLGWSDRVGKEGREKMVNKVCPLIEVVLVLAIICYH